MMGLNPGQRLDATKVTGATLNPALDLSTTTARLEHTHKMRCGPMLRHPGGGGINVARVLHRLNVPVQAWYLSGGVTGTHTGQLLAAEGVALHALAIAGTTRENLSVVETRSGHEYRFVLPGPSVSKPEWQDCLAQLATQTPRWLIASGSLPPGVPDDFYARLIAQTRAHAGHSRIVLDTQGAAKDLTHSVFSRRFTAGSSGGNGGSSSSTMECSIPRNSRTSAAIRVWPRVDMWRRSQSHIRGSS